MKKRVLIGALLLIGGAMVISKKQLPRGIRNNNPLNIRKSSDNWLGAVGDDGAFVRFESEVFGIRAAARILKNYRNKYGLNSVFDIVKRWAPPSENDTTSYIDSVAAKVGIGRNEQLLDGDYTELIKAMIYHENGQQPYSDSLIEQGFEMGFYS
jgi:hypothetical protein